MFFRCHFSGKYRVPAPHAFAVQYVVHRLYYRSSQHPLRRSERADCSVERNLYREGERD